MNSFCWNKVSSTLKRRIRCPEWLTKILKRVDFIVFFDQSTTTRLFFGFTTFMLGLFFIMSNTVHNELSEYQLMMKLAPDWVWALCFCVNGAALMYGAYTNKYSKLQLFLEGVLGITVWVGSAYAVTITQHSVGAHLAGAIISFWVYIRYPTHWEGK